MSAAARGPLDRASHPDLAAPPLPGPTSLAPVAPPQPARAARPGALARRWRGWRRGRLARLVVRSGRAARAYLQLAALALILPLLVPFVFAAVIAAGWTLLAALW